MPRQTVLRNAHGQTGPRTSSDHSNRATQFKQGHRCVLARSSAPQRPTAPFSPDLYSIWPCRAFQSGDALKNVTRNALPEWQRAKVCFWPVTRNASQFGDPPQTGISRNVQLIWPRITLTPVPSTRTNWCFVIISLRCKTSTRTSAPVACRPENRFLHQNVCHGKITWFSQGVH